MKDIKMLNKMNSVTAILVVAIVMFVAISYASYRSYAVFNPEQIKAADPFQYIDFTMSEEEWSRGCYAGLMPTGGWTGFGDAYRKTEDPYYFAGTEAATRWHGYIEGAVLAGEAAAELVTKSLSK
jgi:monoamine oxidase